MSARILGSVAMLGVACFVVAGIALHLLEPGLDPIEVYMSDYALRSSGWLMTSAFYTVGLGTLALGWGLRLTLAPGKRRRPAVVLIMLAGIGFLVAATFKGDPYNAVEETMSGSIHLLGALILFLSLIISAWLLRGVFSRDPAWQRFSTVTLWFAIALTATFVFQFVGPVGAGLGQRIFVIVIMGWLALLGWRVSRLEAFGDLSTGRAL